MDKGTIDTSSPTFTLQRYELTEKFIRTLGLSSRRHTHRHRKTHSKKFDMVQGEHTLDLFPSGTCQDSAEPIPVPSTVSPLAYSPPKSRESPTSSHSPKDIHIPRKPNRKPSFTYTGGNANFNGASSSFVMDKLTSFEAFSKRKKAESFRHFLFPRLNCSWDKSLDDLVNAPFHLHYDPELLDDEDCRQNRHLFSLIFPQTFSHSPSALYGPQLAPPLQVYKSNELKRELNDMFSKKHPEYDPFLKLSHIRSIKIKLLDIALELHIDLSTVALSYAYFEKLFIRKVVVKSNRNKIAGACLLLAVKINDSKDIKLPVLLSALEKRLQVQQEDILKCEFWVFCSLEFGLVLTDSEYWPHLDRLLSLLNAAENIQEYLGYKMYNSWKYESVNDSIYK